MIEMLGSALTAFFEPEDFEAALRESGGVELVVTSDGKFRARMSRISLTHMRLFACEERMSRVAFMSVSEHMVRVTLPPQPPASLIWDGIGSRPGEIITHSAGRRFHERTEGPCRWSTIWVPAKELANAGRTTRGEAFVLPAGQRRWRPTPDALRCLINLHQNAIRATTTRPKLPVEEEAARGLEQQLILALVDCLVGENTEPESALESQYANIMIRFEDALREATSGRISAASIAGVLGVSSGILRVSCRALLCMAPGQYIYLRRLRLVRQALRDANPSESTVAQIAEMYGFRGSDRFTAAYRAQFGESPSVTLQWNGLR
jgi:AraC-like DNA-binding protein